MLFWKKYDKIFAGVLKIAALVSFFIISFIIIFILKESLPLFKEIGLKEFILGRRWKPMSVSGQYLGILPIISATLYVSFTAVFIALPVGIGCSIFLSCVFPPSDLRERTALPDHRCLNVKNDGSVFQYCLLVGDILPLKFLFHIRFRICNLHFFHKYITHLISRTFVKNFPDYFVLFHLCLFLSSSSYLL